VAWGSMIGVIAHTTFLLAPSWEWLFLASVAGAAASSFVAPSYQAFIAEQTTEATRGRVYGLTQAIYSVVGILGPPLGGFLADQWGYKPMLAVSLGFYCMATIIRLIMAFRQRREQTGEKKSPSFAGLKGNITALAGLLVAGGVVTWILISDGVFDISFTLIGRLQPLYLQNLLGITLTQIGLLASVSSIAAIALMTLSGWISDKLGERVGIVIGCVFFSGGLFAFLNLTSFYGLILPWVLFGFGEAMIGPSYSSLISKAVPEKLRGTAFGLFSTSVGILSLPAPWIGSILWETFNPKVPFYLPMIACLLMIPVIWIKFRLPKADLSKPSAQEG
jgi:MFS family permease